MIQKEIKMESHPFPIQFSLYILNVQSTEGKTSDQLENNFFSFLGGGAA